MLLFDHLRNLYIIYINPTPSDPLEAASAPHGSVTRSTQKFVVRTPVKYMIDHDLVESCCSLLEATACDINWVVLLTVIVNKIVV